MMTSLPIPIPLPYYTTTFLPFSVFRYPTTSSTYIYETHDQPPTIKIPVHSAHIAPQPEAAWANGGRKEREMRRLTQAGVRFFEASLEPRGDTSRRVLVDGAEGERERETPAMGGAVSLKQERVRSTCIDRWESVHIYTYSNQRGVYSTREKKQHRYELSEEWRGRMLGPLRRDRCGIEFNNVSAPKRRLLCLAIASSW